MWGLVDGVFGDQDLPTAEAVPLVTESPPCAEQVDKGRGYPKTISSLADREGTEDSFAILHRCPLDTNSVVMYQLH
jgi:hypothetical protein